MKTTSALSELTRLLVYKKEFKFALQTILLATKADDKFEPANEWLPIKYLFNNQYKEARKLFHTWKETKWTVDDRYKIFREAFIADIADLESQCLADFGWQEGYGIFSVSASRLVIVQKYILNQSQHHLITSFKDELRRFSRNMELIMMNGTFGIDIAPFQGFDLHYGDTHGCVSLRHVLLYFGALPLYLISM